MLLILQNIFFILYFECNSQFYENGVAVVENFFSKKEVNDLKEAALNLCKNAPENNSYTFGKDLDSGNKIAYFYDPSAFAADGKTLLVPKEQAIFMVYTNQHQKIFPSTKPKFI